MNRNYEKTIYACFVGYIVQAIVNNFVPLLFLTFEKTYHIPLGQITMLITINFGIQLLVDLLSAKFVDKIGYRICIVAAHVCAAAGLLGLVFLPEIVGNAYIGLLAAVIIYAIGGGLIEVLISPIMESCPTKNKEKAMSLLHSFYCWGHVFVVLVSTAFFALFGTANWRVMACIWAIVPALNAVYFTKVPINTLSGGDGEAGMSMGALCIVSYLLAGLSQSPVLGLIGCGVCGFSVGIMWPGAFSTGVKALPAGGTAMFALMALAGDLGCSGGPTLVGFISGAAGDNLRMGFLAALVFPVLLILSINLTCKKIKG